MIDLMLFIISIITILFFLIGGVAYLLIGYIFCVGHEDASEAVPILTIVGTVGLIIALVGAIGYSAV